ncbi:hypothetical protein WHR41_09265, partial [Cladosporium halotolerans]
MISWSTIQSLLPLLLPLLLPRLLALSRSLRSRPQHPPHPPTTQTTRSLTLLTLSATLFLLTTLPLFHPENVFATTSSRLQTSAGVLLTRLRALRPLTTQDELLRRVFDQGGLKARLLYARFGPAVALHCPIGEVGERAGWALCALPGLAGWHLAHAGVVGLATSEVLCGREAAEWRVWGVVGAVLLGGLEVWAVLGGEDG